MTGSRNLAEYYHWEETGRGLRIYMHSGMADRLQAGILRSAREVGGILLGSVEENGGKATVFIDDFLPVECAYRGGPLYGLSGEDTVNLEAALLRTALAGCESPDAPGILGYYRSHLRDGLSLSPADLSAIESYFQSPSSVFLVVKTVAGNQACTAGFFFWEDGAIQSEFSSLEVALGRAAELAEPELPDPLPDALNPDALSGYLPGDLAEYIPAAAPEPVAAPSNPPRAWGGLLFRAATILIATAALVISVVTYLGAPRPPRQEAAAPMSVASMLGLQVDRNPPDLLVFWNRNAREIVAARRATLSIQDGKVQKSLDLDKSQLAGGSYLYTPVGDDILFRLEVYEADGGRVSQSIRVRL
jgi:hypothetical protein